MEVNHSYKELPKAFHLEAAKLMQRYLIIGKNITLVVLNKLIGAKNHFMKILFYTIQR